MEDDIPEASGSGLERGREASTSGAAGLEGLISVSGLSTDDETSSGSPIHSSNTPADHTKDKPQFEAPSPNSSSASQSMGPSSHDLTASAAPVTQTINDGNLIDNNPINFLNYDLNDSSIPEFMDLGNFNWANDEVLKMMMSQDAVDNPLENQSSVAAPNVHAPDLTGNVALSQHQTPVPNESAIAPPQAPVQGLMNTAAATSHTSVPLDAQAINSAPPVRAPAINATVNAPPVHAPVTNAASHASLYAPVPALNQSVGFQALVLSAPTKVPDAVHPPTSNVVTTATPYMHPPGFNTGVAGFSAIHPPAVDLSTAPPSTLNTSTFIAPPTHRSAAIAHAPAPTSSTIQNPGPTTAAAQPIATTSDTPAPDTSTPVLHPFNSYAMALTTPATTSGSAVAPPPVFQAPNLGMDFKAARNESTRSPFHDLENGIRRSSRAPVPSMRLDKLNEIGDNIIPPKPPTDPLAAPVKPTWFDPAYEHLMRSNLGEAWTSLVEKWAEHERIKGWKGGRGLPAKARPEEWSQFLSKARLGVRNYQSIPNVEDATEFGIAIVNWVKSFSPPDFSGTGPHGIVLLLTLLVWWGTAALTPSSWNDDSCPQWQDAVRELLGKLDQHLNGPVPSKRVRDDNNQDGGKENKRPRMDLLA